MGEKKVKQAASLPLGKIAYVQQGYTFKPEYQGKSSGRWPYAKVADLNSPGGTKYLRHTLNYISDEVMQEMDARPFPAGSIVFPRVGAALRNNNKRLLARDALTDDNVLVITVRDTSICLSEYLYYWFDFHDLQEFCNDGTVPVINGKNLKQQEVLLPGIHIQKKTAEVLSAWDSAIEVTETLVVAKERHYTHKLSLLLGRARRARSHIGDFASEVSERNRGGNDARVLSVTNSRGFALPEDQFERRVASADLSNYKVVTRGQFAYNPSRINVGSIARLDGWDMGVLSPMYVVFQVDKAKANSDYFLHWLDSHEARERIAKAAQGSVRETVSFQEFGAISMPLPTVNEQTAIARYLNAMRAEISSLHTFTERVKDQKRGLMQKLLTGDWVLKGLEKRRV